jgi:hypothetical protein
MGIVRCLCTPPAREAKIPNSRFQIEGAADSSEANDLEWGIWNPAFPPSAARGKCGSGV